jgi:serine/threonine protein kinase
MKRNSVNLQNISFHSSSTYTFLEEIGRGGMGVVYLAQKFCEDVEDIVVLKTINVMSQEWIERLKKEANIAAALRHENIVRSYGLESLPATLLSGQSGRNRDARPKSSDFGKDLLANIRRGQTPALEHRETVLLDDVSTKSEDEKIYLMVMEYVEGMDLSALFERHLDKRFLLPLPISAFIISRICRALAYAHEFIVHRDVSPENILINNQGVARLTDFGIAVGVNQEVHEIAGKIQYMAPEQIIGDVVDNRSDIFSLGLVAYQMATGINLYLPPDAKISEQLNYIRNKMREAIVPPHMICRDIPQAYSDIIMRMLAYDPADRYQSIQETGNDIEKKYIYAKGFGPTNNSLEAYVDLFNADFADISPQQEEQLSFMRNDAGELCIDRPINPDIYTEDGFDIITCGDSLGCTRTVSEILSSI